MGLGDLVETALSSAGLTTERVERWLGKCKCHDRRDKLNALGAWAQMTISKKLVGARRYLDQMLTEE